MRRFERGKGGGVSPAAAAAMATAEAGVTEAPPTPPTPLPPALRDLFTLSHSLKSPPIAAAAYTSWQVRGVWARAEPHVHATTPLISTLQGGQGPSWQGVTHVCPHSLGFPHRLLQVGRGSRHSALFLVLPIIRARFVAPQAHVFTTPGAREQGAHSPPWHTRSHLCRPQSSQ